jgi:uncharacterized protein (DUF1697 family)
MKTVRTYVQGGNVVFGAQGTPSRWAQALEGRLAGKSRLPVSVIVRTAADVSGIVAGNPFLKEKGVATARLAVTFLHESPRETALAALGGLKAVSERFHCVGKQIYLHYPGGFANSKLYMPDKTLSQRTTTRNSNTVKKVREWQRSDLPASRHSKRPLGEGLKKDAAEPTGTQRKPFLGDLGGTL